MDGFAEIWDQAFVAYNTVDIELFICFLWIKRREILHYTQDEIPRVFYKPSVDG
jgi:hypothetical protein